MNQRQLLTAKGKERLEEELYRFKRVELPQNVKDIEEARAHGDLSENAEFHAARERQALIAAKITDLESVLAEAQVVDPLPQANGRVVFGLKVTVYDLDSEEEETYQVVGQAEADANKGRISVSSPIAQALVGKEEGDEVSFKTPGGIRNLEIVAVE